MKEGIGARLLLLWLPPLERAPTQDRVPSCFAAAGCRYGIASAETKNQQKSDIDPTITKIVFSIMCTTSYNTEPPWSRWTVGQVAIST